MEKETIILGAGESGVGAALLAKQLGRRVFVSDAGTPVEHWLDELFQADIEYEVGGHDRDRILEAGLVVKSPGIPDTVPLILDLQAAGIPVISEIEFAFRAKPAGLKLIAITGSNGKTTTTLLTHHLLVSGGIKAVAGGNLGTSFARLLLDQPADVYVLELSSFQLDGITSFRSEIGAILNITPDHLDRYGYDLSRYAASKFRMTAFQSPSDQLLMYGDDPVSQKTLDKTTVAAQVIAIKNDQLVADGQIQSGSDTFDLTSTQLFGRHNALNALFAVRVAQDLGLTKDQIQHGLNSFNPAPHRMELVATYQGIQFINDSKATNVDAVMYALDAMRTPTVWIAGGTDKGNVYDPLFELATAKVRALVCLGVDNQKLKTAFTGKVEHIVEVQSAAAAVTAAVELAESGDTVLLSPACASFDLFRNYIDRGDQFRAAVQALLPDAGTTSTFTQNTNP